MDAAAATPQLIFRLGRYALALPLAAVRAVERPGRFTAVPFAAPWLSGVTAVNGTVVSVVDLGTFAGQRPAGTAPGARLLVTHGAGITAALLVDDVLQLAQLPPADDAVPAVGPLAPWWRGAYAVNGEVVPALDVERLFTSPQFHAYQV